MVGFEKALGAVKVIKDQIQYRSQSLLNLARGYFGTNIFKILKFFVHCTITDHAFSASLQKNTLLDHVGCFVGGGAGGLGGGLGGAAAGGKCKHSYFT